MNDITNNKIIDRNDMGRTIFDVMDQLFDDNFVRPVATVKRSAAPMLNVMENEDAYTLQVAAPGFTREEVAVKLDEEEALVISIQKKSEKAVTDEASESQSESKEVTKVEEKPTRYLRREFTHQSFAQRLLLPEDADKENISAKMENGMLEVVIPKIKEEVKTPIERVITIG